jgi:ribosomal protein S18 acetylase RimI-like enzyme
MIRYHDGRSEKMIELVPMTAEDFESFSDWSIPHYAEEQVAAGFWSHDDASARSKVERALLLPQGMDTPGHHFYNIIDSKSGRKVGWIWLAIDLSTALRSGFIYHISIHEDVRGRGYGREAMLELEKLASSLGANTLDLHVFADNKIARDLYEEIGYEMRSLNMRKRIC